MPSGRKVRLSDVAAVAGVSIATASKALNGSTRISQATRDRVREAAERLDFRPDALARSFASGQSGTIGVLTHRAKNTFARSVIIGAVLQLGEQNQAALVYDGDVKESRAMADSLRELQARRIDGLLVVGDGHEHTSPSVTHHFDVPVTYVFTASSDGSDVMFLPDNRQAGRLATQHLIDAGRTRIAHLAGPRTSIAARRRLDGMREALAGAGLDPVEPVVWGDWTRARGERSMIELLASAAEFDAIFCGNDHLALGALDTLAAAGIRVPRDVALVGIDNWEGVVVDQQGSHRLASVDLELMELGRRAAASLLGRDHTPGEHHVPPTFVPGPSSPLGE